MKFANLISVVFLAVMFSCHSTSVDLLQGEVDQLAKRWVPDRRVDICNIAVAKGEGKEMILKGETTLPGAKTEVLQLLSCKGITVIDSLVVLPNTTKLKKNWGIVSLSTANLRGKPAHSAEMVSQAIMGTPVRVLKEDDGWVLVQTPDHYISWTNESSVEQMDREALNNWRNSDRLMFTGIYGTVYRDADQKMVMSDLVAGAIVVKKEESQHYFQIMLPDGGLGYVSKLNWVNFKQWKGSAALNGDKMIAAGQQFMGFPYLWGGTSSKGMDCSGFIKTICFLNGVIVERDASQQVRHGKAVDVESGYNDLQKGDMLFFGSKQPFRVTHIGMYIGNGEVIHSMGKVRINSLDEKSDIFNKGLKSSLIAARRIIGTAPEKGYMPVKYHDWY